MRRFKQKTSKPIASANPKFGEEQFGNVPLPGAGLPKSLSYYADYGGCGLWRILWPDMLLNSYQKAVTNNATLMMIDEMLYKTMDCVRLQRQAAKEQTEFAYVLANYRRKYGFKMVYEVDDIVFAEDIPPYNTSIEAFSNPQIAINIKYIANLCDKITVVSPFMRQYYANKLDFDINNIFVVPNNPPRFWLDRFYNLDDKMQQYDDNKDRPRIGYCGSGTHFDLANRAGQKDDFAHVVQHIVATRKEFQWVMLGGVPPSLRSYVDDGSIQVRKWVPIYDYPYVMSELKLQAVVAPLANNTFNRAKSDIKVIEAGALGVPGTFQNLECYSDVAPSLFDTGEQMIGNLQKILADQKTYRQSVIQAREIANGRWLENHLYKWMNVMFSHVAS